MFNLSPAFLFIQKPDNTPIPTSKNVISSGSSLPQLRAVWGWEKSLEKYCSMFTLFFLFFLCVGQYTPWRVGLGRPFCMAVVPNVLGNSKGGEVPAEMTSKKEQSKNLNFKVSQACSYWGVKSRYLFLESKNISCISRIAYFRVYVEGKLLPIMVKRWSLSLLYI